MKEKHDEEALIMYLVVRESLNMSPGKIAAQCGHAVGQLYEKYEQNYDLYLVANDDLGQAFEKWVSSSHRKVVLKANENEWKKVCEIFNDNTNVIVVDAGFTEIEPNSQTVIGFWPMLKKDRPKILTKLQLL